MVKVGGGNGSWTCAIDGAEQQTTIAADFRSVRMARTI